MSLSSWESVCADPRLQESLRRDPRSWESVNLDANDVLAPICRIALRARVDPMPIHARGNQYITNDDAPTAKNLPNRARPFFATNSCQEESPN